MEPLSIAVVGAGAVGGYFGARLARSGARVTFLARPAQAEAIRRDGIVVRDARSEWRAQAHATGDAAALADADVALVAVKSAATDEAAALLAPHLRPGALVVSLQNGVDNAQRIAAVMPARVYAAVVYVGADTEGPGRVVHTGRGELVIGLPRSMPARGDAAADLAKLAAMFNAAAVPCEVSPDIDAALWSKLAINCALNGISALTKSRYRAMAGQAEIVDLMEGLVREAVVVAQADGVSLPADALVEVLWKLMASMPDQQSSTAQDLERGRRTEIDSLNGYVARRAAALHVDAPLNRALHALVKLRELNPGA